jgi:hypothetical protein
LETQVCSVCDTEKALSEFHYRNDNKKYRTNCKECRNKAEAARRYNITVGEIDAMRERQDNSCAICKTKAEDIPHASFTTNPLVVDHCHTTGKVRGLLCPTCNAGLGHFKDSFSMLLSAASYIQQSGKEIV